MPFNERGDWVELNPIETYVNFVKKSEQQPGSGGSLWTSDYRRKLHNEAAVYYLQQKGIPYTDQTFIEARDLLERMQEEWYTCDKKNGFISDTKCPGQPSCGPNHYKNEGD